MNEDVQQLVEKLNSKKTEDLIKEDEFMDIRLSEKEQRVCLVTKLNQA